jgi:hypothetical protein
MKIQDALDLFTNNSYIIHYNDKGWNEIQNKLNTDNYTAYNYIYFIIFHLSEKPDFSNICKKSYVTSNSVYLKFKQFMTSIPSDLIKMLDVDLKYVKNCDTIESLLALTHVNPVIKHMRYRKICDKTNEDLEQQLLPYLVGHPIYEKYYGTDESEEIINKWIERGILIK